MKGLLRRIRGWLGNAGVWGAAWSLVTIPVVGLLYALGYGPVVPTLAPRIAGGLFAMGFVAGGSFSTYLGLAYRNKRFDELRPGRFALVGGLFASLLVPIFNLIPGLGMFLGGSFNEAMVGGVIVVGALGGTTAFITVKTAQTAAFLSGSDVKELEPGEMDVPTNQTP